MARVLRRDVLRAARWASATARCDSCRPQRWEIAAAMVLAPTGAAGGRTWYVARALQREARVHGRVPGISGPLDLVRVFTHGRRTGPCAIARAPGPTAKARVSLQTAEHYVAVEALVWTPATVAVSASNVTSRNPREKV